MTRDYRDFVIEMLADTEAELRARVEQLEKDRGDLIEILADLTIDVVGVRIVAAQELWARMTAEIALRRTGVRLRRLRQASPCIKREPPSIRRIVQRRLIEVGRRRK